MIATWSIWHAILLGKWHDPAATKLCNHLAEELYTDLDEALFVICHYTYKDAYFASPGEPFWYHRAF